MKRIVAMVCCLLIVISVSMTSYAAEEKNLVYAENITAVAGENISVPIKIAGNTGFMGFAIFVHFDSDVFTPVSVQGGDALTGLLNNNIGTSQNEYVKVVYTGTENVAEDCLLFTVTFKTADEVYGKQELTITYSPDDTFDERWEPVELSTERIIISFPEKQTDDPPIDPDPPYTGEKLSVRIKNRINALKAPFNRIFLVLLTPLIWFISLFE